MDTLTAKQLVAMGLGRLSSIGVSATKRGDKLDLKTGKVNTPWVHVKYHPETDCYLWRDITYNFISKYMWPKDRFIPLGCQRCYKAVIRPKTWDGLLAADNWIHKMGLPSKVGVENRMVVPHLYGVYFYARGRTKALQLYNQLKVKARSMEWNIVVKRGCTEYEIDFGPSDRWEVKPHQAVIEGAVADTIWSVPQPLQSKREKAAIRAKWGQFAAKFDPTYNGPALFPTIITYHHLIKEGG